jgi:hypothetical protein
MRESYGESATAWYGRPMSADERNFAVTARKRNWRAERNPRAQAFAQRKRTLPRGDVNANASRLTCVVRNYVAVGGR